MLLVLIVVLLALFLTFSCGNKRYETIDGYIKKDASVSISFAEDEAYVPLAFINVVIGTDTIIANANVISMYPGRFLVFFHDKHPLSKSNRIFVRMNHDKLTGEYLIFNASIDNKR